MLTAMKAESANRCRVTDPRVRSCMGAFSRFVGGGIISPTRSTPARLPADFRNRARERGPRARIMTNAHFVGVARFRELFLCGDPNPNGGRVVAEGHDCALALIRPVEPNLLDGVPALPIGGPPPLRSMVETYGYPSGGDQISSTQGVVSRIDRQIYTHSAADQHLAVQTDAAINPGNSGGPVVQEGRIVGVAFQNNKQLESVGVFIPTEVIRHFLADAKDGTYDGYPDLAIRTATLENRAARRLADMKEGESGVRVDWIAPGGSADGWLRTGDVLLRIGGEPIANDGSVASGDLRLPFGLLVDQIGRASCRERV